MIPIHDANGKPVGYTARILPPAQGPKYVNTTSTELYDKSSLIFNYHRAKDEARKAGRVILCEGAMDVLGLAKGGFKEGIACLGTALTDTQLGLIAALNVPVTLFMTRMRQARTRSGNLRRKCRIPESAFPSSPMRREKIRMKCSMPTAGKDWNRRLNRPSRTRPSRSTI
ncbi:toprim domain-containing protein [Allobaculum sp. Allo2]|nr:toprim domain-containing protein [Allobaculum sp. Allo2]